MKMRWVVIAVAILWSSPAGAFPRNVGASGRFQSMMFQLGFGADGCTDHWCDHVDPLVFLRMNVGYRFLKYMEAGLHVGLFFGHPDAPAGRDVDMDWNVFVGPEVRGVLPLDRIAGFPIDLWAGMTLGWDRFMESGKQFIGPWWVDYDARSDGFALGWGFGADYVLANRVGLGLGFWFYKPWFNDICVEARGSTDCDDVDNDDIGVIWTVGFQVTYYLAL